MFKNYWPTFFRNMGLNRLKVIPDPGKPQGSASQMDRNFFPASARHPLITVENTIALKTSAGGDFECYRNVTTPLARPRFLPWAV
jgi:hypothetical protein